MTRARAIDPHDGVLLDDLLFCFFPGPSSYTGEDVLELFSHGNPLLVRRLVDVIRAQPYVRLAEPGEFTRRALEAGKMDLVQAEAIGQLLHATADTGLRNAQHLMAGRLSKQIRTLVDEVKEISALLELEVDFAEEEVDADMAHWPDRLKKINKQILELRQGFRSATREREISSVVFYGAPNAGKSSLVNALLGQDRLLVSPVAGTTRDAVEVRLLLERGELRLLDTAGLDEFSKSQLDLAAQHKAQDFVESADLAVLLVECGLSRSSVARNSIEQAKAKGHWVLYTKADLSQDGDENIPRISSLSGVGIPEFLNRLQEHFFAQAQVPEEFWMSSERQLDCLIRAQDNLEHALALLATGHAAAEELAFELQGVRRHLSDITGQITTDAILNLIFQDFCIGK